MVARVTTCDRANRDYSVASILDVPLFTLLLHKHGFGKESVLNIHVSVHGLVDGNGSIIARKNAWLNRFNKTKINRFGLHALYKLNVCRYFISMLIQSLDDY